MRTLRWAALVAICVGGLTATAPAGAATFTVDTTVDDGTKIGCVLATADDCSLRGAFGNANTSAGADIIEFAVPGAGVKTFTIGSALPNLTGPTEIRGYTQPGSSTNTNGWFTNAFSAAGAGSNAVLQVEIDLSDKANSSPRGGIILSGGESSISGVALYGAPEPVSGQDFPALTLRGGGPVNATGNFIGLKANGTLPDAEDRNGGVGINIEGGAFDRIGGRFDDQRNVIAGNNGTNAGGGIRVEGGANHVIQGNLIGTRPSGLSDTNTDFEFSNGQFGGIEVRGFNPGIVPITNLTIGGTADNAGNLISGNNHSAGAVDVNGQWTTEEVHILSNRIGTDVTGLAALPNSAVAGIVTGAPAQIGDGQLNGNLISGNFHGLRLQGPNAASTVQGNRIGTDREGDNALPNSGSGILLESDDSLIGGTAAGERNILSGNDRFGIGTISSSGQISANDVQGNYIGTAIDGTTAMPNDAGGISIDGGLENTVGGAAAGTENVIAGNNGPGVLLALPEGFDNDANEVIGNKIGVDKNGAALGNAGPGVQVHNGLNDVIGRPAAGEGNVIANNGGDGVLISGQDEDGSGQQGFRNDGNSVRGNSIFANGGLGIDLGEESGDEADDGDGVTTNDAGDGDSGNNELQNFPLVNAALPGASTFVRGFLNSRPNTAYTIDVYRAQSCDASGNGEAQEYLGSATATTNAFGDALWSTTVTTTVPLGEFVTATATDPSGNTSELSACRESGTQVADPAIAPEDQQVIVPPQEQQQQPQQTVTPQQQGPAPNPCRDKKAPITTLKKTGLKNDRRGAKLILNGRSGDHRDCPSGVARVDVSLARVAGRTGVNCRFIKKPNRIGLTKPQNCRRPVLFKATGTDKWTFTFPVRLPRGLYRVQARGTDKAKNKETPKKSRNIVFFEVK
jgi:hypothetical protein